MYTNRQRGDVLMNDAQYLDYKADSPERFASMINQLGGEVKVRLEGNTSANFHGNFARLNRVALFTVSSDSPYSVNAEIIRPYVGLTIPAKSGFIANLNRSQEEFYGLRAHVLAPKDIFQLLSHGNNKVLVCNVDYETIQDYLQRLNLSKPADLNNNSDLIIADGYGAYLHRYLQFLSDELRRGTSLSENVLFAEELEKSAVVAYSMALDESNRSEERDDRYSYSSAPRSVRKTEEFIAGNLLNSVSLADLTEIADLPARTLLRLFKRHYGTSPIRYLRQKRYEAAHAELARADRSETTVTEVATKFGFSCVGRFAYEYRKMFHELPSETLKKRKPIRRSLKGLFAPKW